MKAYNRTSFALVYRETTGVYNLDGTIKDKANIIYGTEATINIDNIQNINNNDNDNVNNTIDNNLCN